MTVQTLARDVTVRPAMPRGIATPVSPQSDDLTRAIVADETTRYFHDVGSHRLLTHQEEIDLSRKVRAGLEARRQREVGVDVENLDEVLEQARTARDMLIRHNLRLVVSIARRYRAGSVPLIDLIQEGNIGLMTAVERYDPELGFRFSTYATFWIRQSIGRAIANTSRTIRIPVHMHDLMAKIRKTQANFEREHGRTPHDEEVATILEVDLEQVILAQVSMVRTTSLDKPIGADGSSTIGDIIPDPNSDHVVEHAMASSLQDQVQASLASLSDRERGIITCRFGIGDIEPMTLNDVADQFGISRERVRQIEKRALEKLRHNRALAGINLLEI